MAVSVGAICLLGAGGLSTIAVGLPSRRVAAARLAAAGQCLLLGTATAILAIAMLRVDGRYAEVADTTSRLTPWPYRIAGLWGGLRGSLLFFTFVVSLAALVVVRGPIGRRAIGGFIGVLAVVAVAIANPFSLLAVPAIDGGGLTPILRHPAMLIHPPMLYAGLGLLIAAAFARLDERATAGASVAVLVGAGVLSAALALGSWWASAELGWVGLWAWDPVENAGLIPLLLAIAAVHTGPARSPRHLTTALVLLAGWAAFAGTVLTRSGAAQSVHAFADAHRLGRALGVVALFLFVLGAVATAAVAAMPNPYAEPATMRRWQFPATIALVLAGAGAIVVAAGTVGPLVRDVIGGARSSVQGTFFARWTAPIAVLALGAMAFADRGGRDGRAGLAGRAGRPDATPRRRLFLAEGTALAAAGAAFPIWRSSWVSLVVGLAVWSAVLPAGRLRAPVALAHLGLAVTIAGAVLSGAGGSMSAPLRPGRSAAIQGWTVRFDGLETVRLKDRERVIARTTVSHDGASVAVLRPSLDRWTGTTASLAETATASWRGVDLQLVLRTIRRDEAAPTGRVVLDVHVRPLIRLAWWGPVLMAVGLGAAAVDRKRRHVRGRHDRCRSAVAVDDEVGHESGPPRLV